MNKQFIEILKNIKKECAKHKLEDCLNCRKCKYYRHHSVYKCKANDVIAFLGMFICPADWNIEEIERYIND